MALNAMDPELIRLRSSITSVDLDIRLIKLQRAFAKAYNPNQPRIPAGNPDGGRWIDAGWGALQPLSETRVAANDGNPRSNAAQNKQVDDVVRILRLTPDQRRQLHLEISGQHMGFQEILKRAKDMFKP